MGSISYTSDPTILGTALLQDGKVAVLAGDQGIYTYSASFSYPEGFDKLQVAIVSPGDSATLSSTGLAFPSGDSPNGRISPAGGGAITALTSGKIAVLTWGGTSANYDVTILNADGSVDTSAFVVGNAVGTGSTGTSAPYNAVGAVAALPDGGYAVAWSANDVQQTYMQLFNSANQPVGGTITVANVSTNSTDWSGKIAVDGQGNILFSFGSSDVFTPTTYALYNSSGTLIATGTTASDENPPTFVGLAGGGFETADYTPSGPWNTQSGYPGFNLEIQSISTSGVISTVATVANADTTDHYTPSISNIAVNASGDLVFQEAGHTDYDLLSGTTLTRDALSPSTPGNALAASPSGNILNSSDEIAGAAVDGTSIVGETLLEATCFMAGTHISTPSGDVVVENLQIGDLVCTAKGDMLVRWIGQSHVHTRFADPLRTMPVRVKAGALGNGLPQRDLLLSPNHALHIDELLVQAGALVELPGISRASDVPERFTYYHIELDSHELIYAEGAPSESFVDNVDRMHFHNWDGRETPTEQIVEMDLPRVISARQLPKAVRMRFQNNEAA